MKSLSEIETTVKRASKAAGYSWGVSEETGKISYVKDGEFCKFKDLDDLKNLIINDLAN